MNELWRKWAWSRYERQVSSSDDFAEFEKLFSGILDPFLVSKMPMILLLDKRSENIRDENRRIVDTEINRRLSSRQSQISNLLSFFALVISLIAIIRAW